MDSLWQDLRYGARLLARNPAFTAVVVVVLALGIGGTTAMFTVVNGVLLQPLPLKHPDRLVNITGATYAELAWWRKSRALEQISLVHSGGFSLGLPDHPQPIAAAKVSGNFFSLIEETPSLGRVFSGEEETPGWNQVAVLSHGLWWRAFAGSPDILGRSIKLNDIPHTVIGVMPPRFGFPGQTDVWVPVAPDDHSRSMYATPEGQPESLLSAQTGMIGKLRHDATVQQAQAQLDILFQQLEKEYEVRYKNRRLGRGARVWPLHELMVSNSRPALLLLLGAVGFLLLIACANVANLLLARSVRRQTEVAIRTTLGADRKRLVRQLLTEGVLLSVTSGTAGLALAHLLVSLIRSLGPASVPRLASVAVDHTVLFFTLAVSLLAGLLVGLVPALYGSTQDLAKVLKQAGVAPGGAGRRTRAALMAGEVAVAAVLLVGAGLTLQSFFRLVRIAPGFDPSNVVTVDLSLPPGRYDVDNQIADFQRRILENVDILPGVVSAGVVGTLPLGGKGGISLSLKIERGYTGITQVYYVAGDYFPAMGLPLLRGRTFTPADNEESHDVIILSQAFAARFWKDKNPVGNYLQIEGEESWREIVGVVGDVKHTGLDQPPVRQFYLPYLQPYRNGHLSPDMSVVVRAISDPKDLIASIRNEIYSVDKYLPVFDSRSMEEVIAESTAPYRFRGQLLSSFAFVAALLAAVGLYGVISFSVSQRTHEIGVRMALGAGRGHILRMVVRQGMGPALIGVGLGLAGAFALTRFLESFLFGVTPTDPATFVGVSGVLLAVALLACYVPARRATRVDPLVALRYE